LSAREDSPTIKSTLFSLSRRRCWLIVGLMFAVALVNYFDRQSLSVVAPRFQAELHLSDAQYGHVVGMFLLASALSYAIAGFITDWLGTRGSMALFVGWWSIAEAMTAFTRNALQLTLSRFCLGLGEPGLWVCAPKAVGEILPKKDRALAVGIYTLGSTVGAIIALPAITMITAHFPWRSVFLIDGCVGLLWLPLWLAAYPKEKEKDANKIAALELQPASAPASSQIRLFKDVLEQPKTWRMMVARGLTDPLWYFYLFWFPKYMLTARALTLSQLARIGWIVYFFAGAGTLLGGVLIAWLIRRGMVAGAAYRRTMLFCAMLTPISPLAGLVHSAFLAVAVASIVVLAHMAWLVTLSSTIIELYPPVQLGKAFGLIAAGSAIGGMISAEIIGHVVMHYGYLPLFFAMMVLHPIALLLIWKTFLQPVSDEAAPA
jgi:ACS family hexuronate transporter-like MFS transporter